MGEGERTTGRVAVAAWRRRADIGRRGMVSVRATRGGEAEERGGLNEPAELRLERALLARPDADERAEVGEREAVVDGGGAGDAPADERAEDALRQAEVVVL